MNLRSRSERTKRGFGLIITQAETQQNDPNIKIRAALSTAELQAWDDALNPGDLDGCTASAYAAARDKLGITKIDALAEEVFKRTEADGGVLAARQEWSSCVEKLGYGTFSSESQLIDSLSQELQKTSDARGFARKEIEISLASFDCGKSMNAAETAARTAALAELSLNGG